MLNPHLSNNPAIAAGSDPFPPLYHSINPYNRQPFSINIIAFPSQCSAGHDWFHLIAIEVSGTGLPIKCRLGVDRIFFTAPATPLHLHNCQRYNSLSMRLEGCVSVVCVVKRGEHILIREMKVFERLRRGTEGKKRTIKVNTRDKMRGGTQIKVGIKEMKG